MGSWTKEIRLSSRLSPVIEYLLATAVVTVLTVIGWYVPTGHHPLGFLYILAVVSLGLIIGRGPVLYTAALSALAWNFVFMPPRLAFSALHIDSALMLGSYFIVALVTGEITIRLRRQELTERIQQKHANALFRLSRSLAAASSVQEIVDSASREVSSAFDDRAALHLAIHAGTPRPSAEPFQAVTKSIPPAKRRGRTLWAKVPVEGIEGSITVEPLGSDPTPYAELQSLAERFAVEIGAAIERQRLRDAVEREKMLASSEHLHRTLLDSVSHELKTPLAILRGAAWKLDTAEEEKRHQLAQEIRTATRRLDNLVANLLNQTRLESGMLKPRMEWCDPRDIINAARRQAAESVGQRLLTMELADDLPLIMADSALMENALGNLVINAAVHTPAGTPITITAGISESRKHVSIRVRDYGPGIPDDLRQALFGKFRRGRNAAAGGLGLGLSIVRGFMVAQGGDVEACNAPEGGAMFTLLLPFQPPPAIPSE